MSPNLRAAVARAAVQIAEGGVIAYPTEAVFGLGCDPWSGVAFKRLLAIKGRSLKKGVILIAADFEQVRPCLDRRYQHLWPQALAMWPAPVTWILPCSAKVPRWITGGRTEVAVRVTAHPLSASLCRAVGGPIVSTSANRSGLPPLRDPVEVRRRLGKGLDGVVAGKVGGEHRPSTIFIGRTGAQLRA